MWKKAFFSRFLLPSVLHDCVVGGGWFECPKHRGGVGVNGHLKLS